MKRNWIALVSYGIINIATTLILKLTGAVIVTENSEQRNFFHPFMQTEIMILGYAICLIPYYLFERNRAVDENKIPAKLSLCYLPLFLDLLSSVLIFVAFNYLTGSVYSILSGESIIFTAIFTKIILKKQISKAQIAGSIIIMVSAALAGIGQSLDDKTSQSFDLLILGIILMSLATAIQSILSIVCQKIYNQYDITPLQLVGYEGIIGIIIWTIAILIMKSIPCPFPNNQCVFDSSGYTRLEDYSTFFSELGDNAYLFILNISFLLVISRFSFDQSTVIATASAFTVCIIRISSNSLVWIIGIILTVIGGGMQQLNLQPLDFTVNAIKFIAFVLSAVGLLTYYEYLFTKCLVVQKKGQRLNEESNLTISQK